MLMGISHIESIQPTMVDNGGLPSTNNSMFITLQRVEFDTSSSHLPSANVVHMVQNIDQISSSILPTGSKCSTISIKTGFKILFLDFNQRHEVEGFSTNPINAVREIVLGILSEHQQQSLQHERASKAPRGLRLKNKTAINTIDTDVAEIIHKSTKTTINKTQNTSKTNNRTKNKSKRKRKSRLLFLIVTRKMTKI